MAHFSLLAILRHPSAAVEDALACLLAPFRQVEDGPEVERECATCLYLPRLRVKGAAREEADRRFGDAQATAERFTRIESAPPQLPTLDADARDAQAAWERYARWASAWNAYVGDRLAWEEAWAHELRAAIKPRPDCARCRGTGREMSSMVFGKWDYWGLYDEKDEGSMGALWRKLCARRPDARAQFGDGVAAAARFHPAAISGDCLRYLATHECASMTAAVVTADGRWHEKSPGLWGIAQLPVKNRHLTFYAADEFWPLCFRSLIERQVQADDVCLKLDCHT